MRIIGRPKHSVKCALETVVKVGAVLVRDGNTFRLGKAGDDLKGLDTVNAIALGDYAIAAEQMDGTEGVQMGTEDYVATKRLGQPVAVYYLGDDFTVMGAVGGTDRKAESLAVGDQLTITDGVIEKYEASATDEDPVGVYDYIIGEVSVAADSSGKATLAFLPGYPIINDITVSGT